MGGGAKLKFPSKTLEYYFFSILGQAESAAGGGGGGLKIRLTKNAAVGGGREKGKGKQFTMYIRIGDPHGRECTAAHFLAWSQEIPPLGQVRWRESILGFGPCKGGCGNLVGRSTKRIRIRE